MGRIPLDGVADGVDGLELAHHAPVQHVRQVQQLFTLARNQLADLRAATDPCSVSRLYRKIFTS